MEGAGKYLSASLAGICALVLAFGLFGFTHQALAADYEAGSIKTQNEPLQMQAAKKAAAKKQVQKGTMKSTPVTKTFTMPKKGYVTFTVSIPKGIGVTTVHIDSNDIRYATGVVVNGGGKYTTDRFSFKPGAKIKVTLDPTTASSSANAAGLGAGASAIAGTVMPGLNQGASAIAGTVIPGLNPGTSAAVGAAIPNLNSGTAAAIGAAMPVLNSGAALLAQSTNFTITMTNKTPKRYEAEPNNAKSKASKVTVGKAFSGNIIKKDADWFAFKAPKAGTYMLWGKMLLPSSGLAANANMAGYNGSQIVGSKTVSSGDGYVKLGTVKLKKGGKAYVKVTPNALSPRSSGSYVVKVAKKK